MVKDHLGNEFETEQQMCEHWGVTWVKYRNDLNCCRTLEEALTPVADTKERVYKTRGHVMTLAEKYPDIAKEWSDKNDKRTNEVTAGAAYKAIWRCSKCGHEWITSVGHRTWKGKPSGCPKCADNSHTDVEKGKNDFATYRPDLAEQWDYAKNSKAPDEISYGSNYEAYFICSKCGSSWSRKIVGITRKGRGNQGCPYCSGHRVNIDSNNSLGIKRPDLLECWNNELNDKSPYAITCGSQYEAYWNCKKCGNTFKQMVAIRTKRDSGCPYCRGLKVKQGFNDLATIKPELVDEWNYEKNGELKPTDIVAGYCKKVWWKCSLGHEWQATSHNRTQSNSGCPKCASGNKTSFAEQAALFYVRQAYPDALNRDKSAIGKELDIWIPSIRTAIEVDGSYYHDDTHVIDKENIKNKLCADNNIRIIRVRDRLLGYSEGAECIYADGIYDCKDFENALKQLMNRFGHDEIDVNIDKDRTKIYEQYRIGVNISFADKYPDLAKEWDYDKNGEITPDKIPYNISMKPYWKCSKCGNSYSQSIYHRKSGHGCPECAKNNRSEVVHKARLHKGVNDLATVYPNVALDWDYEANGELRPEDVAKTAHTIVYWKCHLCGHKWHTEVHRRTTCGRGCPKCKQGSENKKY